MCEDSVEVGPVGPNQAGADCIRREYESPFQSRRGF